MHQPRRNLQHSIDRGIIPASLHRLRIYFRDSASTADLFSRLCFDRGDISSTADLFPRLSSPADLFPLPRFVIVTSPITKGILQLRVRPALLRVQRTNGSSSRSRTHLGPPIGQTSTQIEGRIRTSRSQYYFSSLYVRIP